MRIESMRQALSKLVYDDIGFEDITTQALIPPGMEIEAQIIAKEDGVMAGVDLACDLFSEFSLKTRTLKHDGERVSEGQLIMEVSGDPRQILSVERTMLNLLMRMSGIATLTAKMVNLARKANPRILVAGTRKTTPGLQFFEKEAIRVGGGDTHRYRLDDCVLIKDNHLALVGDVAEAVSRARKYVSFTRKIEVEAETMAEALQAVLAGADIVMLDNMDPDEIKNILSTFEEDGLRDKVLIEVSGGINPDNIEQYAKTGADVISTGYLTHSARSLDMTMKIKKKH
jgi:nicotinate-nucleotide pyrophosphorylase (carboxylating)